MVRGAAFTAAFANVWAAITAIQLYCYYFLNLQSESGAGGATTTATSAQASASAGDLQMFMAFVAAGGLYAAVALVYRHLHQAEAAAATAAGAGNRRLSDLVTFILLTAAGVLDYVLFVDDGDVGAQARALGLVAVRVLPAASIGTFFLGMALMILAHVRAGGEGGGGAAVAGDGPIQAPVWLPLLTKMAFAAVAGLVWLMTMALYAYAKY